MGYHLLRCRSPVRGRARRSQTARSPTSDYDARRYDFCSLARSGTIVPMAGRRRHRRGRSSQRAAGDPRNWRLRKTGSRNTGSTLQVNLLTRGARLARRSSPSGVSVGRILETVGYRPLFFNDTPAKRTRWQRRLDAAFRFRSSRLGARRGRPGASSGRIASRRSPTAIRLAECPRRSGMMRWQSVGE